MLPFPYGDLLVPPLSTHQVCAMEVSPPNCGTEASVTPAVDRVFWSTVGLPPTSDAFLFWGEWGTLYCAYAFFFGKGVKCARACLPFYSHVPSCCWRLPSTLWQFLLANENARRTGSVYMFVSFHIRRCIKAANMPADLFLAVTYMFLCSELTVCFRNFALRELVLLARTSTGNLYLHLCKLCTHTGNKKFDYVLYHASFLCLVCFVIWSFNQLQGGMVGTALFYAA